MPISSSGLASKPASSHCRVPPRKLVPPPPRQSEANAECPVSEPSGWSAVWSLFTRAEQVKPKVGPANSGSLRGVRAQSAAIQRSAGGNGSGRPSGAQTPGPSSQRPCGAQTSVSLSGSQATKAAPRGPGGAQTPGLPSRRAPGAQSPESRSRKPGVDQATGSKLGLGQVKNGRPLSQAVATSPCENPGGGAQGGTKSLSANPQMSSPVAKSGVSAPRTAGPSTVSGSKGTPHKRPPSAASSGRLQPRPGGTPKVPSFDPPRQPSFQPPKRGSASGKPGAPRSGASSTPAEQRSAKTPTRSANASKSASLSAKQGGRTKAAARAQSSGVAKAPVHTRGRSASQPSLCPGSRLGFERPVAFPSTPPGQLSLDGIFIEDLSEFESEQRRAGSAVKKPGAWSWLA
mmetsp:Transcript_136808/g.309102  ORF Transcript_136808/g.309102 Transcript_136808/m.309102 type:complete len:402 (-) Transcript_136808:97-1302(-)